MKNRIASLNRKLLVSLGMLPTVLGISGLPSAASAQSEPGGGQGPSTAAGRIVGRVVDQSTSQPLSGVQVYLAGSEQGAITDVNGRYLILRVAPGTHDVVAEMLGFSKKTVTGLVVDAGATVSLDIGLASQAIELEAITVSAAREQGSTAFLMNQRASSVSMVDAVGATQIGRSPDADAAEVAKRMTGVTVSDGKYVFVRGLGERYSQTALNGSPLPSPEPEREVVPLDLFPAGFLESLTTQKSYTPDQPSDFSGGAVQIRTKDFPDRFRIRLGMGTSFNSMSQGRGSFLTYDGGSKDYLGVDDGTRAFPAEAKGALGGLKGTRLPADDALKAQLGPYFFRQFTPYSEATPLNRSFDLSMGGSSDRFFDRQVGFLFAGSYSDNYNIEDRDREKKFRATSFNPEIPAAIRQPNIDYAFVSGTRSVAIGALGNLSIDLSPQHKISFRGTFNRNTDDEARRYQGKNQEDIGGQVRSDRLRFVARTLTWGQVEGEHVLPLDSRLQWRLNAARAHRDEPGLREALYLNDEANAGGEYYLLNHAESGRMFWSDLVDDDLSGQLDWQASLPALRRRGQRTRGSGLPDAESGFRGPPVRLAVPRGLGHQCGFGAGGGLYRGHPPGPGPVRPGRGRGARGPIPRRG